MPAEYSTFKQYNLIWYHHLNFLLHTVFCLALSFYHSNCQNPSFAKIWHHGNESNNLMLKPWSSQAGSLHDIWQILNQRIVQIFECVTVVLWVSHNTQENLNTKIRICETIPRGLVFRAHHACASLILEENFQKLTLLFRYFQLWLREKKVIQTSLKLDSSTNFWLSFLSD